MRVVSVRGKVIVKACLWHELNKLPHTHCALLWHVYESECPELTEICNRQVQLYSRSVFSDRLHLFYNKAKTDHFSYKLCSAAVLLKQQAGLADRNESRVEA